MLETLNARGFSSRPLWAPAHRQPMYTKGPRTNMTVTDRLWRTSVNLPSSASLTDDEVASVARAALEAAPG